MNSCKDCTFSPFSTLAYVFASKKLFNVKKSKSLNSSDKNKNPVSMLQRIKEDKKYYKS